jgi:ribosomal-protein-alanine N-acetyltransferase
MTPRGPVPAHLDIRLATNANADAIALLSRSEIEQELPWTWTPTRVRQAIAGRATNVAVAYDAGRLVAFGIMTYGDHIAHLHLLAVHPSFRRRDVGSSVLRWLEKVARVAGIPKIRLEARQDNAAGIAFYRKHGYRVRASVVGMYEGMEDGVRLEKVIADE